MMTQKTFDDKFGTDADFEEPAVEKGIREQKEITAKVDAEAKNQETQREYAKKVVTEAGEKFVEADGATKLSMINEMTQGAVQQQLKAHKGTTNPDTQANDYFSDNPEFGKKFRGSKVLTGRVEKALHRFDGNVTRALDSVIEKLSNEEIAYLTKVEDEEGGQATW